MTETTRNRTPLLLLPFVMLWRLFGFVMAVLGRLLCAITGFVLMIAGVALTLTVLAAPAGIPLSVIGFLLLVRALF